MYHNFLDIISDENDNFFEKVIENNNDDNEVINKTYISLNLNNIK